MFKLIISLAIIVCSSAQLIRLSRPLLAQQYAAPIAIQAPQLLSRQVLRAITDETPEPYTFAFTSVDEFGTNLNRQESGDGNGGVRGSYGYTDASGLARIVDYVADDINGFRANVRTNEPGTANANPADVTIQSTASQRR